MTENGNVSVRVFGMLREIRKEQGLPIRTMVTVPDEGLSAHDVAVGLDLPIDRIEGVFCNHSIHDLGHIVHPGDVIAFVPYGTPGPHRFFLGLYAAGHQNDE